MKHFRLSNSGYSENSGVTVGLNPSRCPLIPAWAGAPTLTHRPAGGHLVERAAAQNEKKSGLDLSMLK
jgi:hypothetical protein